MPDSIVDYSIRRTELWALSLPLELQVRACNRMRVVLASTHPT
jgi:hypothetical protein